ncbi:MarR family transcriptional regulator [Phenylobacterium sp.]|uniref:MarR family winged helix-turn-helix transcriptional regulator n=1 Tax=Phenylobacterium sp. TaxID=1871053 RepID=UPI0011FD873A|nr:MarR family transcriptional regulator [Phenylobacterium sp.]THD61308.1 MAG: MarR family transcriptional regulator [Phenylobacterium sp.]
MALDPDRFQALAGFRHALRRFLAASEAISKAAGVTQQQYQAMLAISAWPGGSMSIKDLAEELLLTHHAAVQLVDRLAKADLAQRSPSTVDRRSVELALTPGGQALLERLATLHLEEMLKRKPALTASLRRLRPMESDGESGPETL